MSTGFSLNPHSSTNCKLVFKSFLHKLNVGNTYKKLKVFKRRLQLHRFDAQSYAKTQYCKLVENGELKFLSLFRNCFCWPRCFWNKYIDLQVRYNLVIVNFVFQENSDDQFSLKWNNFQSNLATGFHDLLQEEDMVDVTLAAEGKILYAHKIILSVCSPYFKDLFKVILTLIFYVLV